MITCAPSVVASILRCRLSCARVIGLRVMHDTLKMAGNILKGGRVAIDVEGSHIGGVDQAQLLLKEAGEVGGC